MSQESSFLREKWQYGSVCGKQKKKKGDYVNMDVSPELLDDEIDAVTGKESADDDPRLDEAAKENE